MTAFSTTLENTGRTPILYLLTSRCSPDLNTCNDVKEVKRPPVSVNSSGDHLLDL